MGGRGSFVKKKGKISIPKENREYTEIARIGNIAVIQCDTKSNNPSPIISNTKNTTYYSFSKERNRIERICYYRNNMIFKSVDFKLGEKPHVHYWPDIKNGGGRKSHNKKNIYELSDKDKRLMKKAQEFNKQRNG